MTDNSTLIRAIGRVVEARKQAENMAIFIAALLGLVGVLLLALMLATA